MKISLLIFFLFACVCGKSQSTTTTDGSSILTKSRQIVEELSSAKYWGRGYTNNGMEKAAGYIADQFQAYGLLPMAKKKPGTAKDFYQQFTYDANSFPGDMKLLINGQSLKPGVDFIVAPNSASANGKGSLQQVDSVTFINVENKIVVSLVDKLTWSASGQVAPYAVVQVAKKSINGSLPQNVEAEIENKLIKKFEASNICGYVQGTTQPDSFLFITAHYDHLGGMGKDTYFPGANDNASGIALLLQLAQYYAAHPQKYSIGFICFAGEEIGLLGGEYFTKNPLVKLKKIKFLLNTDLAGTGEEGMTVVNATEFPNEFKILNAINDQQKYLPQIHSRGKAQNSDHYHFTEKGVPAFFFYTMGGITAYHDIFDRAETLPLTEQPDIYNLVIDFYNRIQK